MRPTPPRRPLPALAALVLGALALAAGAACTEDTGVRIIAITATPAAPGSAPISTTSTVAGAAAQATPEPVELPSRPDNPLAGAIPVSEYIAGGLADVEHCLPELVRAWGLVEADPQCLRLDIDGDDRDEVVFLVLIPGEVQPAGDAWLFDDAETSRARLLSSARALANEVLAGLELAASEDLTGDGLPEVVVTSKQCGASTCITDLVIASMHRGTLEDLSPDGAAMESVESLTVEDVNRDGLPDIVLEGGVAGSVGAGPPRSFTRTLSWTGIRFARVDLKGEPEYRFHVIVDADEAYRAGQLDEALELYRRAATDGALKDWKFESGGESGQRELVAYSWFRAAMVAQRQGDEEAMRQHLGRAMQQSGTMHSPAAALYLASIDEGESTSAACGEVERYLQTFAGTYERFWDYGYANAEHAITSLCR